MKSFAVTKVLKALLPLVVLIGSEMAIAGYCAPLNPNDTFLAPTCNLNRDPRRCIGVCTWISSDGRARRNHCVPLNPNDTFLNATCNLNQTPDRCIGVCTWVW